MSIVSNRSWIVSAAWIATIAAAFAMGRMFGWLEEPVSGAAQASGIAASGVEQSTTPVSVAGGQTETINSSDAAGGLMAVTGGRSVEEWVKRVAEETDELFRLRQLIRFARAVKSADDLKLALNVEGSEGSALDFAEEQMLLQKLTQLDARAAWEWMNKEGKGKWMTASIVLSEWARSAPEAALSAAKLYAFRNKSLTETIPLAEVIVELSKTDLDRALREISGVRGGDVVRVANALAAEAIAQRGIEGAAKAAVAMPDGLFRDGILDAIAGSFAKQNPSAAVDWVSSLPAGDGKRWALDHAVEVWLTKEQPRAIEYVKSLPLEADSDSARIRVAKITATTNIAESLNAIAKIVDPDRQANAVSGIAQELSRKNADMARQFISQASLPDEVKAKMLKGIPD